MCVFLLDWLRHFSFQRKCVTRKIVQYWAGELAVMSFNFSILLRNFPLNGLTANMYHPVCSLYLGLLVGGKKRGKICLKITEV